MLHLMQLRRLGRQRVSTCGLGRHRAAAEALEPRHLLAGDLLASSTSAVQFVTENQSMWGPNGPPIIDSGVLFAGTEWDASINPLLGSEAANNFIQLNAATSGKIGLDFQAILDPGSVDASFGGQASLEVVEGDEGTFTIQSQMVGSPTGSLQTRSPNIDLESNFVFELAASLGIRAEVGTPDLQLTVPTVHFETQCAFEGTIFEVCAPVPIFGTKVVTVPGVTFASFNEEIISFDISEAIELLKITNQEIRIFEQTVATADDGENLSFGFDLGFNPLTGLDVSPIDEDNPKKDEKPHDTEFKDLFDLGVSFSMGDVTVEVPTLNLQENTFTTVGGDTGLRTSGATNLARIDIDADFLASFLFGLPPLGATAGISIGPISLFEFSYDLLDVDIGPQFSIGQDFEFLPELLVTMNFSEPVEIGGMAVSQYTMPVGSSVEASFAGANAGQDLVITPTYKLANQFRNTTNLLVAPQVDLLALGASFDTFLGPIFDAALFDPPPITGPPANLATLFNQSYTLGGFLPVLGDMLLVDFNQPPEIGPEDLILAATVDEGAPSVLSGSFVDPDSDQTHTVTIDWGDGSAAAVLELPADVKSFQAPVHSYADDAPTPYAISVTVTDDEGESDDAQTSISVLNVPPTLTPSGPDAIDEGALYMLDLIAADPGDDTIVSWAIDWGDGYSTQVDGTTTSVSHTYADGDANHSIVVSATDEDGTYNAEPLNVTVNNVAPLVSVAGSSLNLDADGLIVPFSGVRGQTLQFTGAITDVGFDNPAGSPPTRETFTYVIDFGDGTPTAALAATVNTVGSPGVPTTASFGASHVYTEAGSCTLIVTVTDDDGGETIITQDVTIAAVSEQVGGNLAVGGTVGDDDIHLDPTDVPDETQVALANADLGTYQHTGRILVFGQAGDDDIQVAGSIHTPAWIDGGAGNDRLKGGGGNNVLMGGEGDDLLVGQTERDLLIGGSGADRIVGGGEDDLLIAGSLVFDDMDAAIAAIMKEWTSDHDYQTRLANLRGKTEADGNWAFGDRHNEDFFLRLGDSVVDLDAGDKLTGSSGDDWAFLDLTTDKATDLKDEAFAEDLTFILA